MRLVLPLLLATSCAAPTGWDGRVGLWGSVREALAEGASEARVEVGEVARSPQAIGLGVLAGLEGEVTVLDGEVIVSRVAPGGALETRRGGAGVQATLLALARVERWISFPLPPDPGRPWLEGGLRDALARAGLDGWETVPFQVQGELRDLRAHVVRGACPLHETDLEPARAPVRIALPRTQGTLVGFFTRLPAGTLTHAGQLAHVHVILPGGHTAHVERVGIGASAVLLLPDVGR